MHTGPASSTRFHRTFPLQAFALVLTLLLFAVRPVAARPSPQSGGSTNGPVGVNISDLKYWISGIEMADLAKRGQEWMPLGSNGTPSPTNALGWPLEPSTSRVILGTYQRFERLDTDPDDRMVLRFHEGTATAGTLTDVDAFGPGVTEITNATDAATGTVTKEYTVVGAQGAITLRLNTLNSVDSAGTGSAFDPQIELWVDPVHMRAHDQDREQVFYDVFLDRLRALRPSFIRMGWNRVLFASETALGPNETLSRYAWDPLAEPRTQLGEPRYTDNRSVPWELSAWLANQVGTDAWVEIPFIWYAQNDTATRDKAKAYIQEMAQTMKDELDPGRKCIVEFSNEMWNSLYSTYAVIDSLDGPMDPTKPVRFVVDAFTWWNEVWNDSRVEFVAMGFTGDTRWAEDQADALKGLGLIDAVGCGGYYFPTLEDQARWGGDDTACANLDQDPPTELELTSSMLSVIDNNVPFGPSGSMPGVTHAIRAHGDYALSLEAELGRPIGLYVYEGGPSLLTNCTELQDLYGTFQHESIYSFYLLYYELLHLIDGLRAGPATLNPPLNKLVDRFGYYAFVQGQSPQFGDFLLSTDLWAGVPGQAVVDPTPQWKYLAVLLFNWMH